MGSEEVRLVVEDGFEAAAAGSPSLLRLQGFYII
jgi:hypothetical protein